MQVFSPAETFKFIQNLFQHQMSTWNCQLIFKPVTQLADPSQSVADFKTWASLPQ